MYKIQYIYIYIYIYIFIIYAAGKAVIFVKNYLRKYILPVGDCIYYAFISLFDIYATGKLNRYLISTP